MLRLSLWFSGGVFFAGGVLFLAVTVFSGLEAGRQAGWPSVEATVVGTSTTSEQVRTKTEDGYDQSVYSGHILTRPAGDSGWGGFIVIAVGVLLMIGSGGGSGVDREQARSTAAI